MTAAELLRHSSTKIEMLSPAGTLRQGARIRAVLFDLDGTLYGQSALRLLMVLELLSVPLVSGSWRRARATWSTIAEFRRVREQLRSLQRGRGALVEMQYDLTARRTQNDRKEVERCVREWIFRRPLKYLRYGRRLGLLTLLDYLDARGVHAGILSDYPVADKLDVLGLSGRFSVVICATDPEVNAFKPHPAGFLRACSLWNLPPSEVLYVGDRPEVDAEGAAAAGMPCAILSPAGWLPRGADRCGRYLTVPSFWRLQRVLDRSC